LSGLQGGSGDFLLRLCEEARRRVAEGYYRGPWRGPSFKAQSLRRAILGSVGNAVIAEFKRASPSLGVIAGEAEPREVVGAMERGGAAGISVLTAREWFGGSLGDLRAARRSSRLPILMKDIVVSEEQVRAAAELGVQSILLILRVFKRGYAIDPLRRLMRTASDYSLEVLLEACGREELVEALETDADLIGVNARDLSTLRLDRRVHEESIKGVETGGHVIVAESGIECAEDVRRLRMLGYRAFLVGASVMRARDVEAKIRELVSA